MIRNKLRGLCWNGLLGISLSHRRLSIRLNGSTNTFSFHVVFKTCNSFGAVQFDVHSQSVPADVFRKGYSVVRPDIVIATFGQCSEPVPVFHLLAPMPSKLFHLNCNQIIFTDVRSPTVKYEVAVDSYDLQVLIKDSFDFTLVSVVLSVSVVASQTGFICESLQVYRKPPATVSLVDISNQGCGLKPEEFGQSTLKNVLKHID